MPGGHRSAPTEPAGETPGRSGKLTHTRAQRPVEARGRSLFPHGRERGAPSRERPLAAPKTSKNADRKKDSLALYGLPKVRKISHIKKISLPRYPPTLWRPKKAHRGPAWGVLYKNRAILWERRAPPPSGSWVITTGTGVGKCFQLWRSDRAGGTAFLISVGVWGAPLPAAFVNSMLYNVLYKCDAGESHNSKGALWWERTLGLPFFANRSGRVTASRGILGPLFLVFVWSLLCPLVFTQQARVEKIALQKPAYFLVFLRDEKPVKI